MTVAIRRKEWNKQRTFPVWKNQDETNPPPSNFFSLLLSLKR